MMRQHKAFRRVLAWIIGVVVAAQSLVIAILTLVSQARKRRAPPPQFPHGPVADSAIDSDALQVYTYGDDLYRDMLEAIDSARESVYLETFIWKGDALGQTFKDHLARKAAEGVAVYVIFDGFANLVVPAAFKDFPAPIHTLEYRTLAHVWYAFDPRRYARDHRKLLVVDHRIAFIGGFNLGQLYATQWRDTHLRITGSAAIDLAYAFTDFWNMNRGDRAEVRCETPLQWPDHIRMYRNDPARLVLPIRGMYLEAINRARSHIYITNAYFIPDRIILSALIAAAQRGVDVRILLPWESNHVTADWLAHGFFTVCLRHGIRIFGYQHAMIHAKTGTIDGIWSTIGTANLDRLSLAGNYEINVEIRDTAFAAEMERVFHLDLTNAFELTLDQWQHRAWYTRASEYLLSPLRPFL